MKKWHNNLPRYVGVTGYNLGTLQRLIEAAPLGSIDTVSINKWHLTQFVTLYQLTIYADFSFISTQSRQYLHNPKIGSAWCASCALLTFKRSLRALQRYLRRCIKKQQIFYGQADRKGGRRSSPSALTISKCENFYPFFHWNLDSLTLKTHSISMCRFSKMHFSCPFCGCQNEWPASCKWSSGGQQQYKEELWILVVGWKLPLSWVKSVSSFIIWGQTHITKKNHEKLNAM